MTAALPPYFDALAAADAARAVAVLEAAMRRGASPTDLIRDVLAPAQRRVGEMWFAGTWSVADEHAATAVSEQALALLCPPASPRTNDVRDLRTVFACAEGEWHGLPARLAAELARGQDVDVVFLGASMPAEALGKHLRATGADVLSLSCTLSTNLLGAARSLEAARAEGVPVVVGGRAWGTGQRRAHALGADLHLDDPGQLRAAMTHVSGTQARTPEVPYEAQLMERPPRELLMMALDRQRVADPYTRRMTSFQVTQTLTDLGWLARTTAAGVACDDPTVLAELLRWLLDLLTPKGVPAEVVLDGCEYLADALEPDAPRCAQMLRVESGALRGSDSA